MNRNYRQQINKFLLCVFSLVVITISCKKTSPQQTVDNYNAILSKYFNETRFTLNNGYYQLYHGSKSYLPEDTTKNGLLKSLVFVKGNDSPSKIYSYFYSINPTSGMINPEYFPDSTVQVPIDMSVYSFNDPNNGNYIGMKFIDLLTIESAGGLGVYSSPSDALLPTGVPVVPQSDYKITNFKFSQLPDGTNQLQIALQRPPFYANTYIDLALNSK